MDSGNVFDIYSAPDAPEAPLRKKKTSKWHPGESSKAPSAKKTRTADPFADRPSTNVTPPPSPLKQQTPPAPNESTPSPLAPIDQTQQVAPASTQGDISSRALRSVKDRVAKILKHKRCREAIPVTEMMDVDQILTRALNEFSSAMLTLTASRLRSDAITKQSRDSEQRHVEELKAAEVKYAKHLEAVLEEKNKLAEELREKQAALDKVVEQRDKFKESNRVNYREAKKLKEELTASRQETTTLEVRIEKLEKLTPAIWKDPSNVSSYKMLQLKQDLSYDEQPERVIEKGIKELRSKRIQLVKVMWKNSTEREAT
ncbi:uncharacterized protein LOC133805950 [Humulus lupulus]|uniref:uncharacterized protein LOC133805950 n=1 Tax=Humulus lupulus TaxID=3486 RepID=UPI002B405CEC|nr:uncharacterized protein LOC133805950 [Humulus lupulus]